MAPPILMLRDLRLTFGGTPLFEGAALAVAPGDRLCLVGRNGSGKSTLLRIAAGLVEPDAGERFVQPGTTLRYLAQEPDLSGHASVAAYVEAGLAPGDDPHRARLLIETLGLAAEAAPATLSGGEARRAALARVLAPAPDILLLDEPTNHLDLPAIEWLEETLRGLRGAIVLVSHDRRFLESLTRATVWVDQGTTRRLEAGFAAFEAWRDGILEEEETVRQKRDRRIAAETEWLRRGVTARRRRNQGRLRALHALRAARREERRRPGALAMTATDGAVSGKTVIEAKGLSKSFGDRVIVADLTLRIQRGDRIGIVGPNGAGKTTLLDLLTGALAPDRGTVRLGTHLEIVTLDQGRESLDPAAGLAATLTGGRGDTVITGGGPRHVIGYMRDFLFAPEQAETPVGALSGGERARLMLARALARPANLLVLDEPTNDLDLETLDLLQELIADHAGTVLLVSHDRDFLDRTVTSILYGAGDGTWIEYGGGYSDMLAQRGAGVVPRIAPETARKQAERRPPPERAPRVRKGLSFKEKHALETLPVRIGALEATVTRLGAALADPALYGRDPARFRETADALARARADLAAAEEEWLALEIKREAEA